MYIKTSYLAAVQAIIVPLHFLSSVSFEVVMIFVVLPLISLGSV